MEALFELLSLINNPQIQSALNPFRFALGGLGLLMLAFVVLVLSRTMWLKFAILFDLTEFLTYRPYGLRRMTKRWEKLMARLETANESEYKLAVIEADGMLNEVLSRLGFQGETLGDKLEGLTAAVVPNLQAVAQAHQVRDNVAHDPDYRLSLDMAKKTLSEYETAFRNLDLI